MSFMVDPHRFAAAVVDGSFDFDGSDDYMELLSAPVTAVPLTIAAWIRADDDTTTDSICSVGDFDDPSRFYIGKNADSTVSAHTVNASSQNSSAAGGDYAAATWHHVVGKFVSATSREVFLDGVSVGTNTTSRTPAGLDSIQIGAFRSGSTGTLGSFFGGQIAHVAVWDIALSTTDITSLAGGAKPNTIQASDLVFYAALTGGLAVDSISTNSLTVSGAVTSSQVSPAGT